MNYSAQDCSLKGVESPLAKIGAVNGYRFDGDSVRLSAMFTVTDPAAHKAGWALQLWACPAVPRSVAEISGHLVTEVALPPIGEVADDTESFEVTSQAWTPANQSEHCMILALVSGSAGQFNSVQDFVVYPRTECFVQPQMVGNVGYRVEGDRVQINVERIVNPREATNTSGTLALELWALPKPFEGGRFTGIPLAGVAFDPLQGQHEYIQRSFDLPFVPPTTGTWHVVMMLREWTAAGYVTRDFTNFKVPMSVEAPAPVARASSIPDASDKALPAAARAANSAMAPSKPKAKSAPAAKAEGVSVNNASREELGKVKGLPTKVADEIVKKRPFASVEDLTKCNGMGAKLLAKLRAKLHL